MTATRETMTSAPDASPDYTDRGPAPDGFAEPSHQNRPWVRRISSVLKVAIIIAVIAYLILRLSQIGWGDVWTSLPTNPAFYLIFLAIYLSLPLSEIVIYRKLWQRPLRSAFPVLLRKQVLNFGVIGYSGEAYFIFWAREKLALRRRVIFHAIKDNNILSAIASNALTLILLFAFFASGELDRFMVNDENAELYVGLTAGFSLLLLPTLYILRRRIFALGARLGLVILGIHFGRLLVVQVLQAGQWAVALPDVPFTAWLMFLTLQMVLTRIPFLPNKDLIFLGAGLSLTGAVDAPEAAVAAMFLAAGACTQLVNLLAFTTATVWERLHPVTSATNGS
ncbi:MAG: hypothetical protein AAGF15_03750 [Pseudomonadota bacterium]